MPFKMPERSSQSLYGLAAITKAKKDNNKYFHIVMETGKDENKRTVEAFVKPEKCPPYLNAGHWSIALSQDKQTIYSAVPADAVVKAEFLDIWHREGEEPVPQTKQGQHGPYLEFSLKWTVVEGDYKGVEISQRLSYNFEPIDWNGKTVAGYTSTKQKSPRTAMLDAVLNSLGVLGIGDEEKPLPWKENLLPIIKKRAIAAREEHGLKSLLTLSNGWVIAVKPAQDSGGWDEEDDYHPEQPEEPQAHVPDDDSSLDEPKHTFADDDKGHEDKGDDEIPWDTEEE